MSDKKSTYTLTMKTPLEMETITKMKRTTIIINTSKIQIIEEMMMTSGIKLTL